MERIPSRNAQKLTAGLFNDLKMSVKIQAACIQLPFGRAEDMPAPAGWLPGHSPDSEEEDQAERTRCEADRTLVNLAGVASFLLSLYSKVLLHACGPFLKLMNAVHKLPHHWSRCAALFCLLSN
ncbi:hypothetical protein SBDP1_450008 [Syntrophobacter sp. SbD1]|nr:hypothetical protein SBDP1_450008 [Syntrophobacter sp. SbD1]